MRKHERTTTAETCLTFDGIIFRSTQTDEEMITLLRRLRFDYNLLMGMCGGPLARLRRDIHDGHTTLPGRTRYESLDLVATAVQRAMETHQRIAPEIRKMERESWWIKHRHSVILMAIVMSLLTAFALFADELINAVSGGTPSNPQQEEVREAVLPLFGAFAGYVLPIILGVVIMGILFGFLGSALVPSRRR